MSYQNRVYISILLPSHYHLTQTVRKTSRTLSLLESMAFDTCDGTMRYWHLYSNIEHKMSTATIVLSQHGLFIILPTGKHILVIYGYIWFTIKTVLIDVTINNGAIISI